MKKLVSFILVASIQILFVGSVIAETKEEKKIAKIKSEIAKLGTGPDARIEVKLKSGAKVKGHVAEANPEHLVITEAKTGQNVLVSYPQIKQAKGNNFNTRIAIAIGVIAFVIFIILAGGAS